jgi:hypothetical protein
MGTCKTEWLSFNVQFLDNGSDLDTVLLVLGQLRGCVVRVSGPCPPTDLLLRDVSQDGELVLLHGYRYEHGTGLGAPVTVALNDATLTVL